MFDKSVAKSTDHFARISSEIQVLYPQRQARLSRGIMTNLDSFDFKILRLIQSNNKRPASEIAEQVGLSTSAVQRRLSEMRRNRIIESDVSVIDPKSTEFDMGFIVMVRLVSDKKAVMDSLEAKMRLRTEVQQCYHVTGNYDFVLVVYTRDMNHFDSVMHEMLYADQHIERFDTHVMVDRLKVTLELPL